MTNPMLAELDEVVRLSDRATQGEWHRAQLSNVILSERKSASGITRECAYRPEDDTFCTKAVNFIRKNHATLADMAKDAARYRWLRVRLAGAAHVNELEEYNQTMHSGLASDVDAAIDATQEGEG